MFYHSQALNGSFTHFSLYSARTDDNPTETIEPGIVTGDKDGDSSRSTTGKIKQETTSATSNGPCVKGEYLVTMLVFGTCIIKS